MNTLLNQYLSQIELGEPLQFGNIVTFPVPTRGDHPPEYLTLTEALQQRLAAITEVSAAGQVPNVKVANQSELYLLLLEGEELLGARQNRTLNTSILLAGKSEMMVPVSCTEAGRWASKSAMFAEANFISPHKLRMIKSSSVAAALKCNHGHTSDQRAVWREVAHLCASTHAKSPTSALHDAILAKAAALERCLAQLKPLADQQGLVAVVNGQVAGLDILSSRRAYAMLHPKFVRGYALEAVLEEKPASTENCRDRVLSFLESSKASSETVHKGIGCGEDHRFQGPGIAGAALVTEGNVIHLNLYRN